eukprot:CAMPEP_0168352898 /NCGR_PEP_ID=MMETSP0213-20121227/22873_1 /TAXON_ID=151035 /ORGANISM="Euplotes harpa, Strain FSP1.4" /LENGTH=132 /DNA_ID=CAMNT_0008364293 /DNA_START=430 /DNA_END=828 /DNA_ORIENTATION=-
MKLSFPLEIFFHSVVALRTSINVWVIYFPNSVVFGVNSIRSQVADVQEERFDSFVGLVDFDWQQVSKVYARHEADYYDEHPARVVLHIGSQAIGDVQLAFAEEEQRDAPEEKADLVEDHEFVQNRVLVRLGA